MVFRAGFKTAGGIRLSRFTHGLAFGFIDSISLYDKQNSNARLQHAADGSFSYRADQAEADALFQTDPVVHTMTGNFIWDLPDLHSGSSALRALGVIVNDWQLSGVWTASTAAPCQIGFNYQNGGGNVNLTGSPDYAARVRVVGDPGSGCSDDIHRQFNAAAFQGPLVGSVGLESGNNYVKGCFQSVLDLSIARNIRLPGADDPAARRSVQRAECVDHHGAQHHHEPEQPHRSGDDHRIFRMIRTAT